MADYAPHSSDPRAKLGPIAGYFDGIISILGISRTGAYGGFWLIKRLFDTGLIRWGWQSQAWSGGNVDPRIHLLQLNNSGQLEIAGVQCDINEAHQPDYGQWQAPTAPPLSSEQSASTIADPL